MKPKAPPIHTRIISDFTNKSPSMLAYSPTKVSSLPVTPFIRSTPSRYDNYPTNPLLVPTPNLQSKPAVLTNESTAIIQSPTIPHLTPIRPIAPRSVVAPKNVIPLLATTQQQLRHGKIKKSKHLGLRIGKSITWMGAIIISLLVGLFLPLSMFTPAVCIAYGAIALIIGVPSKYSFGMAITLLVATIATQIFKYQEVSSNFAVAAFLLLCAGTLSLLREVVFHKKI